MSTTNARWRFADCRPEISADEREHIEDAIYGFPTEWEAQEQVDALLIEFGYGNARGQHDISYVLRREETES